VELWSFVATIARRWRVLVPGVALTLLVCAALVLTAKPNYEARGALVVLLPPKTTNEKDEVINPWFTADAAAGQFSALMVSAVTGSQFEERVAAAGIPKTFVIATDQTRPAVVDLKVTAPTEEQALTAYGKLVEAFREEVNNRQQSLEAPPQTRYQAYDLNAPREATPVRTRVKLAIGLFGVGIIACLLIVAILELHAAVSRQRERIGASALVPT
jgi:capsular polysaccharide biosynthesis protein